MKWWLYPDEAERKPLPGITVTFALNQFTGGLDSPDVLTEGPPAAIRATGRQSLECGESFRDIRPEAAPLRGDFRGASDESFPGSG